MSEERSVKHCEWYFCVLVLMCVKATCGLENHLNVQRLSLSNRGPDDSKVVMTGTCHLLMRGCDDCRFSHGAPSALMEQVHLRKLSWVSHIRVGGVFPSKGFFE